MRIIIRFRVGRGESRQHCRVVVGDSVVEVQGQDRLGKEQWTNLGTQPRGMPAIEALLQQALALTYANPFALVKTGDQLYPSGVTHTGLGIEIDLGAVDA